MNCGVASRRSVAVVLGVAAWLGSAVSADAHRISGAATAVSARSGARTTELAATGPLANADDARAKSRLRAQILELGGAVALHATSISSTDAWGAPTQVASEAALGKLELRVAGHHITAEFVMARATAPAGGASTGSATIEGLTVNGMVLLPSGEPERFELSGATLFLNEVEIGPGSVMVNALRVTTSDGLEEVVIASVTAGLRP
jgi:hypothetical protein